MGLFERGWKSRNDSGWLVLGMEGGEGGGGAKGGNHAGHSLPGLLVKWNRGQPSRQQCGAYGSCQNPVSALSMMCWGPDCAQSPLLHRLLAHHRDL